MIRAGGLDCLLSHLLLHPGNQATQPGRHDIQRVQHQGVMPSEAQFADPDLIIQSPATLFGLPGVFQRRLGLDPGLLVARSLKWLRIVLTTAKSGVVPVICALCRRKVAALIGASKVVDSSQLVRSNRFTLTGIIRCVCVLCR